MKIHNLAARIALFALLPLIPALAPTVRGYDDANVPFCETWINISQSPSSPTDSSTAPITVEYGETITASPICMSMGAPDPSTFQFTVNGTNVTSAFTVDQGIASASAVPLVIGMNTLEATVTGHSAAGDE